MRIFLIVLMLVFTALPAEAKFHPVKFAKRGVCLTVGVATFPVLAPLNYVAQTALVGVCYSRGDWRTASYIIDGRVYDWYWLDRW